MMPEQDLCFAIIKQAVTDARCGYGNSGKLSQRIEAVAWLTSKSEAPWSFRWCAQQSGIAESTKQKIIRYVNQRFANEIELINSARQVKLTKARQ